MKLLRVDPNRSQVQWEPVPDIHEYLGGRALIVKILFKEVHPRRDALGPENKLLLAPGLLVGGGMTTAGRISIGGKSPLTIGKKELNPGGTAGDAPEKYNVKTMIIGRSIMFLSSSLRRMKFGCFKYF